VKQKWTKRQWSRPEWPGYSGGRHQKDHSSKPAQANSSQDLISKTPTQKIGLVEWLKVKTLSSSPRTSRKKAKNRSEQI
jgi:hypothetical protein